MILSEKTVAVLKNFAGINQSILIRKGNTIRSMAAQKTVMAKAEVTESFDRDFGIYDLNRFLGVLSMFKTPELVFEDSNILIRDGKNSLRYVYADASVITAAPDKDVKLPSVDVQFKLDANSFSSVLKAANVIGLPDITIRGADGKLLIVAEDSKNPSTNQFTIELGETDSDFNIIYKAEVLAKLASDDYEVSISKKLISSFVGATGSTYWLGADSASKFNG